MATTAACPALPAPDPGDHARSVVLVGNPNVGKSALFGALTGTYVTVSNYPGTTVEVARAHATLSGERRPVIDTPGAASFVPLSEDERVTRDILLAGRPHAVVVVADAKNLERALLLALQLGEMETPVVVSLNMIDEASARGFALDAAALSARLGVDVVPTVAVRGEGLAELRAALAAPRSGRPLVEYPREVEEAVAAIVPLLPDAPLAHRALALMVLTDGVTLSDWLAERVTAATLARIHAVRDALRARLALPVAWVVNHARLQCAQEIAAAALSRPGAGRVRSRLVRGLDAATTHPVWGFPLLAVVLYLAYQFVGVFGAGTLVELMEDGLFGRVVNPAVTRVIEATIPFALVRDLLVGPYGVFTMALTYSLALVLPIVGTFFVAFGLLEDSGYLPRLAVMVDGLFRRIGLNGKAVLPMVLGLGCDTMATLTTRILETPKERLIVILLLALGVPCSAQLTVILALLGPLSGAAVLLWAAVLAGTILLVGRLAALVLPGRASDFVLELPPLRLPRARNIGIKTLARIEWYLKEAVPLFVLGTLVLFVADRLRLLGVVQTLAEPVVVGLLGLPREAAEAFVVGFLRRDFGAAGLYALADRGRLDAGQAVVAAVTITLFVPCIANFFMVVKERGWRTALAVAAFIVPFAVGVGGLVRLALDAWPMTP